MITLEGGYAFCYLSMVLDAYTEEIIGWSVGPTLETAYPLETLTMALKRIEGLQVVPIHHSDRGCQYASHEYVGKLKDRGISISMTEGGDPKDNAQADASSRTGEIAKCWTSYRQALRTDGQPWTGIKDNGQPM